MTDLGIIENFNKDGSASFCFAMPLYWLSFTDPHKPQGKQFLGACIVPARSFPEAALQATAHNCNPGGKMLGFPIEPRAPIRKDLTGKDLYRAIGRDEMEERGWTPRRPRRTP